jgi:threonyl-tRNA synthetase
MERFLGGLIEHYAGAFPLWLAPVQFVLLTITDQQHAYAKEIYGHLVNSGFRVSKDFRNEKLGLKVREAQLQKIPYMLVIGDREVSTRTVSPRNLGGQQQESMSIDRFIEFMKNEAKVPGD